MEYVTRKLNNDICLLIIHGGFSEKFDIVI